MLAAERARNAAPTDLGEPREPLSSVVTKIQCLSWCFQVDGPPFALNSRLCDKDGLLKAGIYRSISSFLPTCSNMKIFIPTIFSTIFQTIFWTQTCVFFFFPTCSTTPSAVRSSSSEACVPGTRGGL